MNLLANGLSGGDEIVVIALCIAILVVMTVNFLLLIFLHKRNKKIEKGRLVCDPEEANRED